MQIKPSPGCILGTLLPGGCGGLCSLHPRGRASLAETNPQFTVNPGLGPALWVRSDLHQAGRQAEPPTASQGRSWGAVGDSGDKSSLAIHSVSSNITSHCLLFSQSAGSCPLTICHSCLLSSQGAQAPSFQAEKLKSPCL